MEKVLVPVIVTKETKSFIIYNVMASQKEYWSEEELQEILKNHSVFLSLKDLAKEIRESISKGLLMTAYENKGRGLLYKWKG